jgi:hypothetical protein
MIRSSCKEVLLSVADELDNQLGGIATVVTFVRDLTEARRLVVVLRAAAGIIEASAATSSPR